MVDIVEIEEVWRKYLEGWSDELDQHNMSAWTGRTLEALFREIRILRTQVGGLQAALRDERQA